MIIKFIIQGNKNSFILLEWSSLMQAVRRRNPLFSKNLDVLEGGVTSSQNFGVRCGVKNFFEGFFRYSFVK